MTFSEALQALREAKETMKNADCIANQAAELLEGRLCHVSVYRLARLKRELRDFNIHTKSWREDK